jgi:hypothetical protein
MEMEILKALAQYGIAGILVFVLGYIMLKIGQRLIKAIDALESRIDDHTKADVAALYALTARFDRLEQKFDTIIDMGDRLTPPPFHVERDNEPTPVGGGPFPPDVQRERSGPVGTTPMPLARPSRPADPYHVRRPGTKGSGGDR